MAAPTDTINVNWLRRNLGRWILEYQAFNLEKEHRIEIETLQKVIALLDDSEQIKMAPKVWER